MWVFLCERRGGRRSEEWNGREEEDVYDVYVIYVLLNMKKNVSGILLHRK